ncbi:MAG: hypothetical protein PHE32_01065 [Candidatus Shapirobacteria bacterium]|nr:hypothetical protein [Candidatus Shapirobacteria bacterium]MDD4410283.1 hypothetical protein [Candidatus Shapirobacteria bacterium]
MEKIRFSFDNLKNKESREELLKKGVVWGLAVGFGILPPFSVCLVDDLAIRRENLTDKVNKVFKNNRRVNLD